MPKDRDRTLNPAAAQRKADKAKALKKGPHKPTSSLPHPLTYRQAKPPSPPNAPSASPGRTPTVSNGKSRTSKPSKPNQAASPPATRKRSRGSSAMWHVCGKRRRLSATKAQRGDHPRTERALGAVEVGREADEAAVC